MKHYYSFENLDVWKVSKQLVIQIYTLIEKFPKVERYALCDQLRRACVSVPSNIAEGSGRTSLKEKVHFISIAYSSLMEVYCQLQIAEELQYIQKDSLQEIYDLIYKNSLLMTKYREYLMKQSEE